MTNNSIHIETTPESFDRDVFEASRDKIVIVDFYADWCQPCRMLDPVLKDVIKARNDRFALVKANTERLPDHAQAFSVSSIPVLFAVAEKTVIDRVEGLLTQRQLEEWLDSLTSQLQIVKATKLEESDPVAAAEIYRTALNGNPKEDGLKILLIRALLKSGDSVEASKLMSELERRGFLEPEAQRLKSQLKIQTLTTSQDFDALIKAIELNPNDHQRRLELVNVHVTKGEFELALQQALEVVQRDRTQFRKAAQELMLDIFRILTADDELVGTYRRKLAMAMY
jgi:putative thioredoxin